MVADANNLIWIDMEMTGLQPEADRVIEIAMLVTDPQLNVVATGPVLVVHQPDELLEAMDTWNKSTHAKTGLIERVRVSSKSEATSSARRSSSSRRTCRRASRRCAATRSARTAASSRAGCRGFEAHFHYRNLDVSTLKELVRRWKPELKAFSKEGKHEALADILESIEELKFYRKTVMTI